MGGSRKQAFLIAFLLLFLCSNGWAKSFRVKADFGDEKGADQKLANKIVRILESSELTVGQYIKDASKTNSNSLNPFESRTTYHSNAWSYCLEWTRWYYCKKWLDPYVAGHGLGEEGGDHSPLERDMASMWKDLKKEVKGSSGGSMQYGIWNIEARSDKKVVRKRGRVEGEKVLDPTALAKWELVEEAVEKAEEIGSQTADRAIAVTYDEDAKDGKTMPNMESLRAMAAVWTRALRNRLVANIGEARAATPGIEFELNEGRANCEKFLEGVEEYEKKEKVPGGVLINYKEDLTRMNKDPEKRYKLCVEMRDKSIYAVNPTVRGAGIGEGSPDDERLDAALNRINVALIDYAGMDPNKMAKPAGVGFGFDELANEITDYEVGGKDFETNQMTNAGQLESYNAALRQAAASMKGAAARSSFIKDTSRTIASYQIALETKRIDQINGLTDSMKKDLKDTAVKEKPIYIHSGVFSANADDESIEKKPSQLTITTLGE